MATSGKPLIFLDWDGVLSDQLLWHSFKDGSPKERYLSEQIKAQLFDSQKVYLDAWKRGKVTSEQFVHDVSEMVGEEERVLWYRFVDDCKTMGFADLAYLDAIEELRRYARVVLATDTGEHFRRFVVPGQQLDRVFDNVLISAERGCFKKEPERFFGASLDEIVNHRALIVDDTEAVCRAFIDLGGEAIEVGTEVSTHRALSDALQWAKSHW